MILKKILAFVDDDTTIILWQKHSQVIARGRWFNDRVLEHCEDQVDTFSWYDNNIVHVDLKED